MRLLQQHHLDDGCVEHAVISQPEHLESHGLGISNDVHVIVTDRHIVLAREGLDDLVDGALVETAKPIQAQRGTDGQEDDGTEDDFARSSQHIVPQTGIAMERAQMLGKQDQLGNLDCIPLGHRIDAAHAVGRQDGQKHRRTAIAAILEQIAQSRALSDPIGMLEIDAVEHEKQQNVGHGKPRAGRGVLLPVLVDEVPRLRQRHESRGGNDVGCDGVGNVRGQGVERRAGGPMRQGLVGHILLPLGEGALLRRREEQFEPTLGGNGLDRRGGIPKTRIRRRRWQSSAVTGHGVFVRSADLPNTRMEFIYLR